MHPPIHPSTKPQFITVRSIVPYSQNDRDVTAAKNIRDEALRFLALGTSAAASGGNVSRGGKISSVLLDAVPLEAGSPLSTRSGESRVVHDKGR